MINKSNDLPSFVNETNLPKIVDKLTDASNIKIANNKYGNRVQTVIDKIVEKADDVTKAIKHEVINDSYSFKVGTGNVDVSTDVQDGFGEVGVKGVTYQNIFNNFSMSGEASKYITVNENTIKWTKSAVTTSNINIKYHNSLAQLNKTYTLVFYIYKNTLQREGAGDSYSVAKFNIVSYNSGVYLIPVNKTGLVKVKLIQPTTIPSDGKPYLEVLKDSVGELEISYPILLEGDCTNDDKIPSQFEGIVGVGDKSKNLFNGKLEEGQLDSTTGLVVDFNGRCRSVDYIEVNKNTDYRIQIKSTETSSPWTTVFLYDSNKKYISYTQDSNGASNLTFNTSDAKYIKFKVNVKVSSITEVQIKKGNSDTPYEPYYDGHKIEILSCGKNLFNESKHLFNVSIGSESARKWGTGKGGNRWSLKVPCKPNTTYTITKTGGDRLGVWTNSFDFDGNKEQELDNLVANTIENNPFTFTTPSNAKVICIYLSLNEESTNVFLEESATPTPYAPYVEDKTQILLDEPLMRLPNGVHDEITRDGKLIKRVGKIVLNGSEDYIASSSSENTMYFILKNLIAKKSGYCMSNNFYFEIGSNDNEHIRLNANGNIVFWIKTSKLASQDSAGVKQWLSQNPTTVYYELAEPIITELPAPCLRIFKDGHLTFNTLVAPESNHVVQLNKSAQIQNAIKESQSLDNRINVLENNYDNLILFTMSRLSDLELNYTLK